MMSKMEIDFTDGPINPFHTDQQQEAAQESPSLESKANDGIKIHHSNSSTPSRSCHHCRVKKKLNCRVYNCSNEQCRLAFCENCLRKHYEQTLTDAESNQETWTCPKCRGICRCSHCKERGDPSHRISRRNKDKEITLEKNEVIAPRKAKMNALLQEKEETSSDFESEITPENSTEQTDTNEDPKYKKMPKRLEEALESLFIQIQTDNGTTDEHAIKNLLGEIGTLLTEKHAYTLRDSASRSPLHVLAMTDNSLEVLESIMQGKEKILYDMLCMRTDTKQTPFHFASVYGSEKMLKYFLEFGNKAEWMKSLLRVKDKEGKTCYDRAKDEAIRQILEPFFHKEFEPAHAPKEARHMVELTALTSRKRMEPIFTEVHPLVEKLNSHKRKKLNVGHDTCGIEAVDKARNLPPKKTGPFKDFIKYLTTHTAPVKINRRISLEANWMQYGPAVTYSNSLFWDEGINIQDSWIRSDAFDNYYQLDRVDDLKDWVRIDNSKVGTGTEGQIGLFANVELSSGMCLCEFAGKLVSKSIAEKQPFANRKYLVDVHSMDFDIDAETMGNESRFINNSTDRPNAQLITVYSEDGPHVLVYTKKTIKPDDEILIDFGPQFRGIHISDFANNAETGVMTNVW